ncbi:MAG TPA: choice-of-anchor Q domain-containing protein [bacterium]|nr:choice-of-anchor Q domain-containing protein [bacterium]
MFSAVLGVSGWLAIPSLQAATITPNILTDPAIGSDMSNCSLRYAVEAINLADNSTVPGCAVVGTFGNNDTIVLGEGTYALTEGGSNEDNNLEGDLDVLVNLIIQGAGSGLTTIDASGIDGGDRIVQYDSGDGDIIASVIGLTMTGGDVTSDSDDGGAIDTNEVDLTLQEVVLTGNDAGRGGGLYYDGNEGVNLVIIDSTIDGNVVEEIAPQGGGFCGGGGGIYIQQGNVSIVGTTISNNQALSDSGGGICDDSEYLFLTNSTVSSNTALGDGGGIVSSGGLKGLYNVTIAFNEATEGAGGGMFNGGNSDDERFTTEIFNTIVAQNTAASSPDCIGEFLTGGNNLIGQIGPNDQCTNFVDGSNGDQVGTDTAPIDPLLGPLADNGGPTQTHALLVGSPAIDRGNPNGCQALDFDAFVPDSSDPLVFFTLTDDQRHLTRPVAILDPAVPICDIGAFEVQATPTPTPTPIITPTPTPTPPFQGFLEGSGCTLAYAGPASVQGLGAWALFAAFSTWTFRRLRRRAK